MAGAQGLVAALMEEAHRAAASGRRELARQRLESALYLLRTPEDAGIASTLLRRIARTYIDDGNFEAALDCLAVAEAVAAARHSHADIAHVRNSQATICVNRGALDEAERLYHEASQMAQRAGDEALTAMVEQNLGVIASMHGEPERALAHYEASLDRYRVLELKEEMARLLNNIGLAQVKLERWDDATRTYRESHALAKECGDGWTRMMVEVNHVALLIGRRELEAAKHACDRILLEAGSLREKRVLAEAYKHAGVIAREDGRHADAETFLQMAYDESNAREDLLLAAETAREQAELYLLMGRNRATLQALSQSHRLFSQLRARQDLADIRRRMHHLEHRFENAVQEWAQNIESKDAYTAGHCERVADYACAIAADMGFDEPTLFWFRVGALLHDVGKIVVHSEILNKPGPLTPEERREMEKHPEAGVELLRDIDFPWDVFPMIRGHHERWDGHGYPDRLAGERIPLPARILGIADVYDALTSDRAYRRAYSSGQALQLMQADAGRAFDPDILPRFVTLVEAERHERRRSRPISLMA